MADGAEAASEMAAALADMMVAFEPLVEAMTGYRARLVTAGIHEVAADTMVTQLHGAWMGWFFALLYQQQQPGIAEPFRKRGQ